MPTYVYKFVKTGETIEVTQAFTDPALTEAKHPTTGRRMTVKKVFTPVGVTFRGDGFYKTDSRNSSKSASKTPATSESSTSTSESSSTSSTSSDSTSTSSSPAASTPSSTTAAAAS